MSQSSVGPRRSTRKRKRPTLDDDSTDRPERVDKQKKQMSRQVAPVEVVEDVSPEPAPMAPVSASDEKYAAPAPVSSPTPPVDASPPVQKLVEQADEPQEPHIELVQSPILADARHITYNCVYCQHTSDDTVAAQRHLETCIEKPIRYHCCHCPAISKSQLEALELLVGFWRARQQQARS